MRSRGHVKHLFGLFFMLSMSFSAHAAEGWNIAGQHAALAGTMAIGGGYTFKNELATTLLYGRTALEDRLIVINQYTFKLTYTPWRVRLGEHWHWGAAYPGVFATYTDFSEYFLRPQNSRQPDNYYDQTAIRYGVILGTEMIYKIHLRAESRDAASVYFEVVALDPEITQYYKNHAYDDEDILSAGIGVRYYF